MIRQVSFDVEIPDEVYDSVDDEIFATEIENATGFVVLGITTTASWIDQKHYKNNDQSKKDQLIMIDEGRQVFISVYRDTLVNYCYNDDRFDVNVADVKVNESIVKKFYEEKITPYYNPEDNMTYEQWREEYTCDSTDDFLDYLDVNGEQIVDYDFESYSGISLNMIREQLNAPHLTNEELVPNYELAAECYRQKGSLRDFDYMVMIQKVIDDIDAIEYSDYQRINEYFERIGRDIMEVTTEDAELLFDIIAGKVE